MPRQANMRVLRHRFASSLHTHACGLERLAAKAWSFGHYFYLGAVHPQAEQLSPAYSEICHRSEHACAQILRLVVDMQMQTSKCLFVGVCHDTHLSSALQNDHL